MVRGRDVLAVVRLEHYLIQPSFRHSTARMHLSGTIPLSLRLSFQTTTTTYNARSHRRRRKITPTPLPVRSETHDHSDRSCLIWMGESPTCATPINPLLHSITPLTPSPLADHAAISLGPS